MMYNFACPLIKGVSCTLRISILLPSQNYELSAYEILLFIRFQAISTDTVPAFLLAKSRRIFGGNLFSSSETLQEQLMTQTPLGFM